MLCLDLSFLCFFCIFVKNTFVALSSDPHSASEAVIRGGGGGAAGERSQKPAEDVSNHVYSSSTADLHVLAHLPPH